MLANSESRSDSLSKKVSYHRRLNPSKFCSDRVELNENRTTSAIGANRTRKNRPVNSRRNTGRSKSFGGRERFVRSGVTGAGASATVLTPSPPARRAPPSAGRPP